LHGKYQAKLDYEGKVVQSCMHCHQVRDAERRLLREERKSMPDEVLYPYPMPEGVGLALDPAERATVKNVVPHSAAEKAGLKAGDKILALEGQPILSIADFQWVLQNAAQPATLQAQVLRGRRKVNLELDLAADWRRHSDIAWRTTTWDLRRMAAGGMVLEDSTAEDRQAAKLTGDALALRVKYVGEYGEHAVAKRAGFRKEDIVVSLDGQTSRMTESQVFRYLLQNRMPGDKIAVTVLRGGERTNLELPMQ